MEECPKCKLKTFIVSVFGSICSSCLYDPKYDANNEWEPND